MKSNFREKLRLSLNNLNYIFDLFDFSFFLAFVLMTDDWH